MMGYPESLTDPSFAGQILVLTYPLVGNYGVPPEEEDEKGMPRYLEGRKIYPVAVVVSEYSFVASHYAAVKSLSQWLEEHKVPGIFGVDTRAITKRLREEGSALGAVVVGSDPAPEWENPNLRNLVAEVSVSSPQMYEPDAGDAEPPLIVAVDCGMKFNIVRYFVYYLRVRLRVVPWDYDFSKDEFDGLFISNGPGDPEKCEATVQCLRRVMQERPQVPIFGICLGHQLLALAAGCKTYKMKFGNRGVNQPCVDLRTGRCYITSQNHGFAVDDTQLPPGWEPLFVNANDGSNEGIGHKEKPWLSVQFHPEACCGPVDTAFLFDEFFKVLRGASGRSLTTVSYKHPQAISKVLVLGSGGLTIGQAGEFDYSGSQAIKALREQKVQSVLINPNIATVQTSRGLADQIFFVPVTPEFVTKVIEKVRPDGLFAAFGGQTALNCAVQLHRSGVLQKYGVRVLGTQIESIVATEDREIFKAGVESIGEQCAKSACANTMEEARQVAKEIGFPVLVRAAFALGGLGSGFASNEEDLDVLLTRAFATSSQVIIDECLKGWKELEYEVVRDAKDNCLVVCNMENLDPMGVHTGESIVVAPSQTLNNFEYHHLRAVAIKVIRHFGIVGEANIQYALDPHSSQYRIVEVNARLSRSSALASKATGYPLAYVAAKLALGHDLVSLRNMVTRSTTACFEPSLDYCVVKMPRWDIDKFPTVERTLGTQMKSVGEVMSIARSFPEAMQKALRMVNEGSVGFDESWYLRARAGAAVSKDGNIEEELQKPGPLRMWAIAHAFQQGFTVETVHALTRIDRWFLGKLFSVHQARKRMESLGSLEKLTEAGPEFLRRMKQLGFCDRQIGKAIKDSDLAVMHQLCKALNISGPFNVQFMALEDSCFSMRSVKVIECNVRASRTVPFVSKTFNVNFIEQATRVMLGQEVSKQKVYAHDFEFVACKAPMFSFLRLSGADPHLGVEMQSTGEVACFGHNAHEAFLKSLIASGVQISKIFEPCGVLLALNPKDKAAVAKYLPLLDEMGFKIFATHGTASFLEASKPQRNANNSAICVTPLAKSADGVVSAITEKTVKLVICTPSSRDSAGQTPGYKIRRKALETGACLIVNMQQALMLIDALYEKFTLERQGKDFWTLDSWQECHRIG
ncbi:unnamed protein product [Effrenium voratum]|uniref:Uncharacterized protein n=1 Tax=Effrenium voratum TaxID=2562239 RepID=A0AA36MV61_9DINO|nr:unnamed protein product [Effrenium voratum]